MALPRLARPQLVDRFRTMLRIRRFEEALIRLAGEHDIGHYHVYIGQEATGVAALALLEPGDVAYTTHRNHGHLISRGVDPARLLAEILGRATGTNRGKGGTLHLASAEHGFPSTSASVGGPLPIAVGSAFAFKELGSDRVSLCLFGDGALEEGAWHEAINIAAYLRLPVIFLCENNSLEALGSRANEYSTSTLAVRRLTDLVRPFGVPAVDVDGADASAVHRDMRRALRSARRGDGPTFIEAWTVRWAGSRPIWPTLVTGVTELEYAWDPDAIPGEHSDWFGAQDGLLRYLRELLAAGIVERDDAKELDREAQQEMERAVSFAMESPFPESEEALEDVYA
jgi:pyruvate dehydrogenase E1 component alpha subunit